MGDRGNIKIVDESGSDKHMFFYTHWSGSKLPTTLKNALIRGKSRWEDPQYLSRIIFCEMIQSEPLSTTGYGLSTHIGDGLDRVIEIMIEEQQVFIGGELRSFDEYVTWEDPQWPTEDYGESKDDD